MRTDHCHCSDTAELVYADQAAEELRQGSTTFSRGAMKVWIFGMRYVIPVVVFGIVMGYLTGTL